MGEGNGELVNMGPSKLDTSAFCQLYQAGRSNSSASLSPNLIVAVEARKLSPYFNYPFPGPKSAE